MLKCQHFNIYEQEKFHAQLNWAWKKFDNLGAWLGQALYPLLLYTVSPDPVSNIQSRHVTLFHDS